MKHKAKQSECNWGEPEAFALVPEKTLDGDRIAAQKQQSEADRKEAETKQPSLI